MHGRRYVLPVCLLLCVCCITSDTQVDTRGQEFILSFANNYINKRGPSVIVTNESSDRNASVVIDIKGMTSIRLTVQPASFQRVRLPMEVIVTKEQVPFPAVHITSDIDITVVGINNAHVNAVGGFLALPVHTLGTDYVAGTYSPWLSSQIVMAALEDNTYVRVRVAQSMSYGFEWVSEGMVIALSLNRFEALMIEGLTDLTGTVLYSNKNIAVFSGNRAVIRPWSTYMIDHTVEQLVPFKTWGKRFVLVPYPEEEYSWNVFRVVIRNRTRLSINTTSDRLDVTISIGHYQEITLSGNETAFVEADYPVSVFHYAQTNRNGIEGADMSISNVSPVEQYVHDACFTTSGEVDGHTTSNFLTITSRCDAINETTIDNLLLNVWLSGNVLRTVNSEYCFAHVFIPHPGLHFVNGSAFLSVLHSFTTTSSYAFPIALGQEAMNCKTTLPDGRIFEHGCHQEIIPVECQYQEVSVEAEEKCEEGYSGLQVFVIALFSAGGAICIDLIIRCFKEATEPPTYAEVKGNKKWTTSISELRERRKAIRLRSMENEFSEQNTKDQTPPAETMQEMHRSHAPIVIEEVVPVTLTPEMTFDHNMTFDLEINQYFPPTSNELVYQNANSRPRAISENESDIYDKESESDTNSYVSLAYNESKV